MADLRFRGNVPRLAVILASMLVLLANGAVRAVGPEIVSDDPSSAYQSNPQAVSGSDGRVYAIWTDERNSISVDDAYFSIRDPNTDTWSVNERVDDSSAAVSSPTLGVDGAANVYVLWADARNGDDDIWFSKRSAGTGSWSPSVRVNDDRAGSVQNWPAIAVSNDGSAIAVWTDGRSRKNAIYSARLAPGATHWSTNFIASSDTKLSKLGSRVAVGTDGRAYAIWDQYKNGVPTVQFTSLAAGSSLWTAAVQVSQKSPFGMFSAGITVDAANNLAVAYTRESVVLYARVRPAGSVTWSPPVSVGATGGVSAPTLAMRSDGAAYLAWQDIDSAIYDSEYDPGSSSWSSQVQLAPSIADRRAMSAALTGTESVVVSEDFYDSTGYDIRAYAQTFP